MRHSSIIIPTDNDILFGGATSIDNQRSNIISFTRNYHLGNIRFRNMILKIAPQYKILEDGEKFRFTDELMNHVRSAGSRFLEMNKEGIWVLADHRRTREKISQELARPAEKDIVFGKGAAIYNHVGNVRFRQTIKHIKLVYHGHSIEEKKKHSKILINHVLSNDGRFMEKNKKGQWVLADNRRVREKVYQALRQTEEI